MYEAKHAKGGSTSGNVSWASIEFQFNPKEVTITKSAKWERKPAKGAKKAGPPEFTGAEPCKMTLEMFFDAALKSDLNVVDAVEKLFSCCVPLEKTVSEKKPMPPLVVFKWGGVTAFRPYVSQVQGQVHPIRLQRRPDPGGVHGEPRGDAVTRTGKQNPTSGVLAADRVHTMVTGDTLPWSPTRSTAIRSCGGRWPPTTASTIPMRIADGTRVLLPRPTLCWLGRLIDMATTASFLVELDDSEATADDDAPLLMSAYVDCSLRLPDAFMLRFRDPGRIVVEKSGVKIGSKVKIIGGDHARPRRRRNSISAEVTSLEAEVDGPARSPSSGATTRRIGCSAVGTPSPTRRQRLPTPSPRSPSGRELPAGDVNPAAPFSITSASAGKPIGNSSTGSPSASGTRWPCATTNWTSVLANRPDRTRRDPARADTNPLVLRLGSDLLRFRSVITAAEQVGKVEVRGWDVAQKRKIVSTESRRHQKR